MSSRGLLRLKAMVEYVLAHPDTVLVYDGD
jgi:hypothetical protein